MEWRRTTAQKQSLALAREFQTDRILVERLVTARKQGLSLDLIAGRILPGNSERSLPVTRAALSAFFIGQLGEQEAEISTQNRRNAIKSNVSGLSEDDERRRREKQGKTRSENNEKQRRQKQEKK